jgi:xanthosine utilization system XapX-like protein
LLSHLTFIYICVVLFFIRMHAPAPPFLLTVYTIICSCISGYTYTFFLSVLLALKPATTSSSHLRGVPHLALRRLPGLFMVQLGLVFYDDIAFWGARVELGLDHVLLETGKEM